jgi:hypothetical protein
VIKSLELLKRENFKIVPFYWFIGLFSFFAP